METSELDRVVKPCTTWDALASEVSRHARIALEHSKRGYVGGLVVGALIVTYAEREEVRAEMNSARREGPGRPITPHGYVAAQLSKKYKDSVPALNHLRICANAALEARERGFVKDGVKALLGYDRKLFDAIPDVKPPMLPKLKGARPDVERSKAEFDALLVQFFAMLERRTMKLLSRRPMNYKMDDEMRANVDSLCQSVNSFLNQLHLGIVDAAAPRRKG